LYIFALKCSILAIFYLNISNLIQVPGGTDGPGEGKKFQESACLLPTPNTGWLQNTNGKA